MTRFLAYIRRFLAPVASQPPATPAPAASLPYSRLSLREWQASEDRVAYVAALFRDPTFRELVGMLANVRPALPATLDGTSAAFLLGVRAGHDQLLSFLLASAASPPSAPKEVPIDYAAANVMAEWEREVEA